MPKTELESGMKAFQHKQAQKFSLLLADWKQKEVKMGCEFQHIGAPTPSGPSLDFVLVLSVFFRDMFFLMGLEVDASLCSAGFPYSFQVL